MGGIGAGWGAGRVWDESGSMLIEFVVGYWDCREGGEGILGVDCTAFIIKSPWCW